MSDTADVPVNQCPNTLPGMACVDPACTYCRIARAEEPRPKPEE